MVGFWSLAEDMIAPYVNLALKSNKETFGNNIYMDKLLRWELCREPFFNANNVDGQSLEDSEEIINGFLVII